MRLLAAAVAALALAGVVAAANDPQVAAVRWPGETEGGAQFVTDGATAWILSGGLGETNVFRIDGRSLVPKAVRIPRMFSVFAGDGQLWGVQDAGGGKERLVSVDVRHGHRPRLTTMPRGGCESLNGKTVVHRGRLWFECSSERFVVYDPARAAPVKEVRKLGTLVESKDALWLFTIDDVLECVEGPCRGARIAVGPAERWATDGDTGWAFRSGSGGPEGFVTLVGFRARGVADFTLKLPPALREPAYVRVVGDELWVGSGPIRPFAVARYRINAPELAPRLLRLPGLSPQAQTAWPVETSGGYAWVSVKDGSAFKVFRVAVPRDPPALRQVRAAVLAASVRTPAKLAIARGAGLPLHASCHARKPYLQVRAYYCVVRFRRGAEYMCVAVARGRLVVDRRLGGDSACA